jgi:hypothetical protein
VFSFQICCILSFLHDFPGVTGTGIPCLLTYCVVCHAELLGEANIPTECLSACGQTFCIYKQSHNTFAGGLLLNQKVLQSWGIFETSRHASVNMPGGILNTIDKIQLPGPTTFGRQFESHTRWAEFIAGYTQCKVAG